MVALFTLASAACGLAPSPQALIASRIVQAVGGALLTPSSLTLILAAFPPEKRAPVVGLWAAVGALAAAAVVPADADVAVPVRVQQRLQLGTVF